MATNDKLRVTFFCKESDAGASAAAAHRQAVQCSARSQDGRTLFTGSRDSVVGVWRVDDERPSHWAPLGSLLGHDDWVNDVLLIDADRALVTASSDTSLKVWRVGAAFAPAAPRPGARVRHTTLRAHADYATALAHAPAAARFFSVGLDARCFAWSVSTVLQECGDDNDVDAPPIQPCGAMTAPPTASLYAVASTRDGAAVVTGSVDHLVRVWDPNVAERSVLQLAGHVDVVRCVAVDATARLCLSASTDRSVRLWDLRARRCVRVFEDHNAAVWSLAVDDRFETFLSGDRDGHLFLTDVATGAARAVAPPNDADLVQRREAILHTNVRWSAATNDDDDDDKHDDKKSAPRAASREVVLSDWQQSVFRVTSCEVVLSTWQQDLNKASGGGAAPAAQPVSCRVWRVDAASCTATTLSTLQGRFGVRRCVLLPDRRHALSADDDGTVRLWDLCRARELCSLGNTHALEVVERVLAEPASLRAWSSVKPIGGRLAVVVDALQALQCRTYANEAGFASARHKRAKHFAATARINVGERVLAALFRHWVEQSPVAAEARSAYEARRDEAAAKKAAKEAKELPASSGKSGGDGASASSSSSALSNVLRRVKNAAVGAPTDAASKTEQVGEQEDDTEFATAADAAYRIASDVPIVLSDRVTGATLLRATSGDMAHAGALAPWLTAILCADAALAQAALPSVPFRLVPLDASLAFDLKDSNMTASPLCKVSRLVVFAMRHCVIDLPRKSDLGAAYRKFQSSRRRAEHEQQSRRRRLEVGAIDAQYIAERALQLDAPPQTEPTTSSRRRRHRRSRRNDDESSASSSSDADAPGKSASSSAKAAGDKNDDGGGGGGGGGDGGGDDDDAPIAAVDYVQILIKDTELPMTMDIATAKSVYWHELDKDVEFQFRVDPRWKPS
jgi:WD40 repeat protein